MLSIVAMSPFLWPYLPGRPAHGLARDVNVVTQYNAGWRDYLVTGGRLHFAWWSHVFYEGRTALFPGVTALVLAAIAVVTGRAIRDPRARMALAIGVLGVALSFGTSLPGYAVLHEHAAARRAASATSRDGDGWRWRRSRFSRDLASPPSRSWRRADDGSRWRSGRW